jgi:hypothetical protein
MSRRFLFKERPIHQPSLTCPNRMSTGSDERSMSNNSFGRRRIALVSMTLAADAQ